MNTANHDQAVEYLKRYESVEPFPGHLFLDPSKTTHRHFGLFYGVYRSLIPPILLGVPKYGLRGAIEGAVLGYKNFSLAGSSWQQGGVFVIDRPDEERFKVIFSHREQHPADFADLKAVLMAAGVPTESIENTDDSLFDYINSLNEYLEKRKMGDDGLEKTADDGLEKTAAAASCSSGACAFPPQKKKNSAAATATAAATSTATATTGAIATCSSGACTLPKKDNNVV